MFPENKKEQLNMTVTLIAIAVCIIRTETGSIRNQRKNRGNPDYKIVQIGQNTQMARGDLRRLTATYSPVKV